MPLKGASNDLVDVELLAVLACPDTGLPLHVEGQELVSEDGERRYPVVGGIPCLMPTGVTSTHPGYDLIVGENARWLGRSPTISDEHFLSYLTAMMVDTCGNLFWGWRPSDGYPIPRFPAELASDPVIELGCNWGRWSIAGTNAGRRMIGVDIHLQSLLVAKRLFSELKPDVRPWLVLADARRLPFRGGVAGGAFSYSVVQHFSKPHAAEILKELGRVLRPGGQALVQMPNVWGLKSTLTRAGRGFRGGSEFEVRFYSPGELMDLFGRFVGEPAWAVDCFFGLNVHASDRAIVRPRYRPIIDAAEAMRRLSDLIPPLRHFADSLWVRAVKAAPAPVSAPPEPR